jgi:hypothetical protein
VRGVRYALGVDIGTSFTATAVWRWDGQQHNKAEVVALGGRMPSVPSVLFLGADGAVVVGVAAERRALTDPDRVVPTAGTCTIGVRDCHAVPGRSPSAPRPAYTTLCRIARASVADHDDVVGAHWQPDESPVSGWSAGGHGDLSV